MRMNSYLTSGSVIFERLGHHGAQRVHVGAVGDDQKFAAHEPVGAGRKGGAGERHRVGCRRLTSSMFMDIFL
jgi:hypothetical protein